MSFTYNGTSDGSLRKGWTIKMGATYLLGILATKTAFIENRLAYWTDELAKATKPKTEKKGDTIQYAGDDDDYKPSNRRPAYCKEKLASYQAKLKEARNWSIFFETAAGGGDEFAVTLEDALYFGLKEYASQQR